MKRCYKVGFLFCGTPSNDVFFTQHILFLDLVWCTLRFCFFTSNTLLHIDGLLCPCKNWAHPSVFPSLSSCGYVPTRPESSALDNLPRRTRAGAATRPPLTGYTVHNRPRRPAPTQEGRRQWSYACGSIPARPRAASRSSAPPHEAARELVPTPSCELVGELLSFAGSTCGAPLLRRRTNREAGQAWVREGAGRICSPPLSSPREITMSSCGPPGGVAVEEDGAGGLRSDGGAGVLRIDGGERRASSSGRRKRPEATRRLGEGKS
jgi:hypothetical protein